MINTTQILLVAPLLLPVAGGAVSGELKAKCAARKPIQSKIEVVTDLKKEKYDYQKSTRELTAMSGQKIREWNEHNRSARETVTHTSGLTLGQVEFSFETSVQLKPSGVFSNYYCPYVRDLNVTVTYTPTIFVTSDYKQGSCRFNEVLKHEHKHNKVNIRGVRKFSKTLKEDLPEIVEFIEGRQIQKGRPDSILNAVNENLHEAIQFYIDESSKKMREDNNKIDTPEEYSRVARACGGRLKLW